MTRSLSYVPRSSPAAYCCRLLCLTIAASSLSACASDRRPVLQLLEPQRDGLLEVRATPVDLDSGMRRTQALIKWHLQIARAQIVRAMPSNVFDELETLILPAGKRPREGWADQFQETPWVIDEIRRTLRTQYSFGREEVATAVGALPSPEQGSSVDYVARRWFTKEERLRDGGLKIAVPGQAEITLPELRTADVTITYAVENIPYLLSAAGDISSFSSISSTFPLTSSLSTNALFNNLVRLRVREKVREDVDTLVNGRHYRKLELPDGLVALTQREFDRIKSAYGLGGTKWTLSISDSVVLGSRLWRARDEAGEIWVDQYAENASFSDLPIGPSNRKVLWLFVEPASGRVYMSPYLVRAVFYLSWAESNANSLLSDLAFDSAVTPGSLIADGDGIVSDFQKRIGFLIAHELAHVRLSHDEYIPHADEFDCDSAAIQVCRSIYGTCDVTAFEELTATRDLNKLGEYWGIERPMTDAERLIVRSRLDAIYGEFSGERKSRVRFLANTSAR